MDRTNRLKIKMEKRESWKKKKKKKEEEEKQMKTKRKRRIFPKGVWQGSAWTPYNAKDPP